MNGILKNRSLLTLGVAESLSGVGSWITMLAVLAIIVFRGSGGVAQSSGIFLAGLLPTLLCSPLAGWLCDRYERKRLMVISQFLNAIAVAGLIFAPQGWCIYALLALQAAFISVLQPARQALIPDMVSPEDLTRANAFLQQLAGIVKIGAPVMAGAILAVVEPHTAIVLDVVCIILSAFMLSRLPAVPRRQTLRASDASAGLRPEPPHAAGGAVWALLRASARLQLIFAGVFLSIIVIIGFDVLSSVLTRDVLGADESLLGLLIGLVGLGSTAAAAWLLFGKGRRDPWVDVTVGLALLACLPAAAAIAARLPTTTAARLVMAAGCVVGGVGNGLTLVQIGTLLQRSAPSALLGRLAGLYQSIGVAGQLVGILLTPLLVPGLLSAGGYFAIASIVMGLVVALMAWMLRRTPASFSVVGGVFAEER